MDSSNNITVNVFFKLVTPTPKWYNIVSFINELGTDICKAFPFSTLLQVATVYQALMGKENARFGTNG